LESIKQFGQTPRYKQIVRTIERVMAAKRKVAIEMRQMRSDARRAKAEADLLYDDVRSVAPNIGHELFDLVYGMILLDEAEQMLDALDRPPSPLMHGAFRDSDPWPKGW